ncbi:AMP-binding protein [Acidiferrobacter sp.]|uniref:AMP-binding protein n=1 Tax=Acidiferrobacter sp. TaxID=1872107 RepID=UPI0026093C15|nr:AMP-binding protein [Acidiferrobacter sp.]
MEASSHVSSQALLDVITTLGAELHPAMNIGAITLDSSLDADLGLDSLARMELLHRVEASFGTTMPEQVVAMAETPRDLWNALRKGGAPEVGSTAGNMAISALKDTGQAKVGDAETLIDVLNRHIAEHPQKDHVIFAESGEVISYALLGERASEIAAGLHVLGLSVGQTVAIMLPTCAEYFYSFYGILLAGGIPVPIYPPARLAQVEDHLRRHAGILGNAVAFALITTPEALPVARLLQSAAGGLRHVVTASTLMSSGTSAAAPPVHGADIAFLQYTSGSTGNPKGVILTHANLLANIRAMGEAAGVGPTDVFVSWLPLYHDMGLIGAWLGSLYHGLPLVIMSPLAFLARPERWLKAIHHYHGTLSAAPNFAYELCLRKIPDEALRGLDLRSWRRAFNGAEAVSAETITRFQKRFTEYGLGPHVMAPVYGLAECSVGLALPPVARGPVIQRIQREPFVRAGHVVTASAGDTAAIAFVACGQPLPGHQIRIVDADGHEVGDGQEGLLQFRGPSATQGYFRNPAATQELFDGPWLRSGDLAYRFSGDIYITGRVKDIIVRAGRNLYPHEIEETVGAVPGVRKGCVAVFGAADAAAGTDRLVVLAETRETGTAAREDLRREIQARVVALLGEPADQIALVPPHTVLKTSSGKIRRLETRALYEQGGSGHHRLGRPWRMVVRLAWARMRVGRPSWRQITDALYGLYAGLLFIVLAPLTWLMVAVVESPARAWRISHFMARLFLRLSRLRFAVHGLAHVPRDTPCILVANHASYLDGILLIAALPQPCRFVAKRELADHPITDVYLRRIGTHFVERFRFEDSLDGLKQLLQAVRGGQSLILFPEGTFRPSPGLLPFRMGAFMIAAQTGVPLIAVSLRGSRSVLRDRTWLPHYGAITITISPPIRPPGTGWPAAMALRDAARAEILRHNGEHDAARGPAPARQEV